MSQKVERNKSISIRLTSEEKLDWELKAHATGLSISQLAREAIAKVKITRLQDRNLQKERTRQIAKIGNNLNQIARWANTYKSNANAAEVISHLIAIESALLELANLKPNQSHE